MFSSSSPILRKCHLSLSTLSLQSTRTTLEALARVSVDKIPNSVLYNYPSFSGGFASLFSRLYHSHLILLFSFVEALRVDDLKIEGLDTCYLLDFVGPNGFAVQMSRFIHQVVVFSHRKRDLSKIPCKEDCPKNLAFNINHEKSSSTAVYEYFLETLRERTSLAEMM